MNIKIIVAGASALSLAAGAAAGYFVANKRLKTKYEQLASEEIAAGKEFWKTHYKGGEFATPSDTLQRRKPGGTLSETDRQVAEAGRNDPQVDTQILEKIVTNYGGKSLKQTTVNVFEANRELSDAEFAAEVAARDAGRPYILSYDEFMEADPNFAQLSYTYYEGDGVLADEQENEIDDVEAVVGVANLDRFGYMSKDPKVLYVRNERFGVEFEINLSGGKYSEEVAGITQG